MAGANLPDDEFFNDEEYEVVVRGCINAGVSSSRQINACCRTLLGGCSSVLNWSLDFGGGVHGFRADSSRMFDDQAFGSILTRCVPLKAERTTDGGAPSARSPAFPLNPDCGAPAAVGAASSAKHLSSFPAQQWPLSPPGLACRLAGTRRAWPSARERARRSLGSYRAEIVSQAPSKASPAIWPSGPTGAFSRIMRAFIQDLLLRMPRSIRACRTTRAATL